MSYESRIDVFQNDEGYDIALRAWDEDNNPIHLSGYTCLWRVWEQGVSTYKFQGVCSITNASGGLCSFRVSGGYFDEGNKRYSSILVISGAGFELKAGGLDVHVLGEGPTS